MSEPVKRIRDAVRDSAPNPRRPRISPEFEEQFEDIDRESAACYAQFENLSDRFAQLAEDLSHPERFANGSNSAPVEELIGEEELDDLIPDNGVVSEEVFEEDSLVVHIDEVRRSSKRITRLDTDEDFLQREGRREPTGH
jgi:hypothetical protein